MFKNEYEYIEGQRDMYRAIRGNEMYAVILGQEYGPYDKISDIFMEDNHFWFVGRRRNGKYIANIDGNESSEYDEIKLVCVEHHRAMYAGRKGKKWVVVIDGVESEDQYDAIECIRVSPSGKNYGFVARKDDKFIIVINGSQRKVYSKYPYLTVMDDSYEVEVGDKVERFKIG